MANETLNIGIIGGGAIVRHRHMPGLAKIPDVKVVAVCNRRRASAERFAADYDVPRVVDRWQDVVAMDDVHIIWIGTTPYLHAPVSVAALEAGKHVFCQARMARNLAEARKMLAAAVAHPDRVNMLCPPPMGMPGDRVMRRLLGEQRFVGELRHVHLRNLAGHLLEESATLHWRLDKEQSGLNAFALGIYVEVLNRWLGPARRVSAVTRRWTRQRKHPETGKMAPAEIPESIQVLAELANDAVGVYEFGGVCAHSPGDTLEIYGSAGTLIYHFGEGERIEGAPRTAKAVEPIPIPETERCEWRVEADFIRAVRTGEPSSIAPDFRTGLRYMAFVEVVYESAANGRAVDVPSE